MDKLRRALSGDDAANYNEFNDDEEHGLASRINESLTLNWSSRIQGFLICFILGFVFSIIGAALIALPKGLILFSLFYTIGNITSVMSTMFLMGPWKQMKKMFNESRIFATLAVLGFMILTLISALMWRKTLLTIIFCIFQFLAFTWYSISYIPYARDFVRKTVTSCV